MARSPQLERRIAHIVALRRVAESVSDHTERERLARVERELRDEVGRGVPKRRAAAVLGVSVTALDRWIARGRLPTIRRPGSSRQEIDADALLAVAEGMERLRERGQRRGVLGAAIDEARERLAPAPRPNQSAQELREHFLRTTPEDRLREVAELSRVLTGLAASGAAVTRPRTAPR
jgi:hypothetical protein